MRYLLIFSWLSALLLTGFLWQCSEKEEIASEVLIQHAIPYGSDSQEVLDLWTKRPDCLTRPLIVVVHGGGWVAGSRAEMEGFASLFATAGFSVANLDYKLADSAKGVTLPQQLACIHRAIDYLHSNDLVSQYSNGSVVLFGYSAGAHLSLMYAYQSSAQGRIAAVAAAAAPTLLGDSLYRLPSFLAPAIRAIAGSSPQQLTEASPCHYTATACPTLLIHGTLDGIVPYSQSVILRDRLADDGCLVELISVEGDDHSFHTNLANEAWDAVGAFFTLHGRLSR